MNDGELDCAPPDALHGIAHDARFRLELRVVGEMLELASAAAIDHEVHAGGLNPLGRRDPHLAEFRAGEATRIRHLHDADVTGRGTRNEDDAAVGTTNAVATRGDGVDRQFRAHDQRALRPSRRPTRSQASSCGITGSAERVEDVIPPTAGVARSRSASSAAAMAATTFPPAGGCVRVSDSRRRSSH